MPAPYRLSEYTLRYPGEAFFTLLRGRLRAYERLAATDGDLALVRAGKHRLYLLNHPDLVRELLTEKEDAFRKGRVLQRARALFGSGLLTSEGALHRRHRRLVARAFHLHRIRAYADTMVALTRAACDDWHPGRPLQIDREMTRLTLRVVTRTLFGTSMDTDADAVSAALRTAMHAFARATNPLLDALWTGSLVGPLLQRRALRRLDAVILGIIRERRSVEDRGDLLSMLLAAQDTESGDGLTDEEVRDEALTLFLSGHETTAVALTWTWILLGRHPEVARRLHAEVDDVLGQRPACFDDLGRLPYTRQVLSEVMRLYPPIWVFGRQADRATSIGGHPIPPGAHVLVSPYLLHRHPHFWPHPERFDPTRFEPTQSVDTQDRHRFAYLPFSAGPRGCIGEQFAWTEGVLAVATIAQQWHLRPASPGTIGCDAGFFTLRPDRPVVMTPELR